jgi:hypothetical protein
MPIQKSASCKIDKYLSYVIGQIFCSGEDLFGPSKILSRNRRRKAWEREKGRMFAYGFITDMFSVRKLS